MLLMKAKEENGIRDKPRSGLRQSLPLLDPWKCWSLISDIHLLLFEASMAPFFISYRTPGSHLAPRKGVYHY
jgi:hypothetical protein